jgi:Ni2+-binding GTPase involved in maturation of urease and hydrogenase
VFAVVVTGPPGSGKTVTLTALRDVLIKDRVAHAAVDVDEVAWAYPYPDVAQRCEHLRVWAAAQRRAGHERRCS